MKFSLAAITALVAPIVAQSTTPAPSTTTDFNGPPWATNDPARWSSIYSSLVSDGRIPSTLTAAPWPTGSWGPGSGPWGPGHGGPGGRHWGGPDGDGPWGSSFPYSEWATNSAWREGPWTRWWGGSACPPSDWPGWTAGPWSTSAPWTSWSGCSAQTTATSVVTTTVNGSAVTTTAFGLQVAAASADPTAVNSEGNAPLATAGLGAAIGAAVIGVVVGL